MSKKKKNKEKVIYYDDNSTIADMSNVTGVGRRAPNKNAPPKQKSTFTEKWNTYWSVVRKMIMPMLFVLLVITVLYLIFSLIGHFAT